jgi:hypothetical protein
MSKKQKSKLGANAKTALDKFKVEAAAELDSRSKSPRNIGKLTSESKAQDCRARNKSDSAEKSNSKSNSKSDSMCEKNKQ